MTPNLAPTLPHFIRFLFDFFLILFLFRALPVKKERAPHTVIPYLICQMAILPGYFYSWWIPGIIPRFFYQIFVYSFALSVYKKLDIISCCYYAIVGALSITVYFNIFYTPYLYDIVHETPFAFIILSIRLLFFPLQYFISRLMHFEKPVRITPARWCILIILAICELYIKFSLEKIIVYSPLPQLTVCFIALQFFILATMVLFEHFLYMREMQEAERVAEIANEYRYKSAISQHRAAEDVRRLHHDMKNHLLAIRRLSGDNERLDSYVDGLMDELGNYELRTETGNSLLNGLLSEKMRTAEQKEIDVNIQMDFRPLNGLVDDMDICVIFGNLLDNAIEASGKLSDPLRRSILVKSHEAAGALAISFSNFYEGDLKLTDGLPPTTKENKQSHGIGLSSVRRSVEKYGGILKLRTTDDHRLILTVLLPLPPQEESPKVK